MQQIVRQPQADPLWLEAPASPGTGASQYREMKWFVVSTAAAGQFTTTIWGFAGCMAAGWTAASLWMHLTCANGPVTLDDPRRLLSPARMVLLTRAVNGNGGSASLHPCVKCGEQAYDWAYDGTDPTQLYGPGRSPKRSHYYSQYPEFYMPLCRGCHSPSDAQWRRQLADQFAEFNEWKRRQESKVS